MTIDQPEAERFVVSLRSVFSNQNQLRHKADYVLTKKLFSINLNLMKEQGQHVIGIHFITGFEAASMFTRDPPAVKKDNVLKIGEQLGISVEIVDIRAEFQEKIVGYFCRTYQRGQTPNP